MWVCQPPSRYFFVVEEDNTPLAVTVTPCDAPLEWKLSVQELPEEASGEGSGNKPSATSPVPFPAFLLDLRVPQTLSLTAGLSL